MSPDRVMIWRFGAAPKQLRSLYRGNAKPEWLVFVPKAVKGPDLDDLIMLSAAETDVLRYKAPDGGIVYVGKSSAHIPKGLAALVHAAVSGSAQRKNY